MSVSTSQAPREDAVTEPLDADLVVLTCPDDAIASVAQRIANSVAPRSFVVHCSGAGRLSALQPIATHGRLGIWHPMASVVAGSPPPRWWTYTAEGQLADLLRDLTGHLNGSAIFVADQLRPRYHAATVFATNYVQTLVGIAGEELLECGFDMAQSQGCAVDLANSALRGVASQGMPQALTGPLRRGDAHTVRAHLAALSPERRRLYASLATATASFVQLDERGAGYQEIRTAISEADRTRW